MGIKHTNSDFSNAAKQSEKPVLKNRPGKNEMIYYLIYEDHINVRIS